jgi:hypothetical protein
MSGCFTILIFTAAAKELLVSADCYHHLACADATVLLGRRYFINQHVRTVHGYFAGASVTVLGPLLLIVSSAD